MKVFALLTGKGGSSLKNKNLIKILGKKILDYPCLAAKKVKSIDDFYVSSECKKILNAAYKNGFKKIKRPKNLSRKTSKHEDVLKHSLDFFQSKKITPEILVVLLANSPTIKKEWIEKSIKLLKKNKKITSVVPVNKNNDFHPLRAKKISKRYLKSYIKYSGKISTNRQDLASNYFLTHNFWTIRTSSILKNNGYPPWKFMGKKCFPMIINNSIDIHEKIDLVMAKYLIKNYY